MGFNEFKELWGVLNQWKVAGLMCASVYLPSLMFLRPVSWDLTGTTLGQWSLMSSSKPSLHSDIGSPHRPLLYSILVTLAMEKLVSMTLWHCASNWERWLVSTSTYMQPLSFSLHLSLYLAHFQARDTMRNGTATFQYDDVGYTSSCC